MSDASNPEDVGEVVGLLHALFDENDVEVTTALTAMGAVVQQAICEAWDKPADRQVVVERFVSVLRKGVAKHGRGGKGV